MQILEILELIGTFTISVLMIVFCFYILGTLAYFTITLIKSFFK